MTDGHLLSIKGLNVNYETPRGIAFALRNISLDVGKDTVVGLVGESGSGKSTLALAIMGLLPENAAITADHFHFEGREHASNLAAAQVRLRGRDFAMVFQDPMSALNPLFPVGTLLIEAQRAKYPEASRHELLKRAEAMLVRVGVPDAGRRMRAYPHEFSGGMRQRIMIAMAFLVEPGLLLADEPTTALDATIEAQILTLLRTLREQTRGTVLLVSHSLGLVSELCNDIVVIYAGVIVERGKVLDVLTAPLHPYTNALIGCEIDPMEPFEESANLRTIEGSVPDLVSPPKGCIFAGRCPLRHDRCSTEPPMVTRDRGHAAACWLA